MNGRWALGGGVRLMVGVAVLLVLAGVVLGRAELALLGSPLVLLGGRAMVRDEGPTGPRPGVHVVPGSAPSDLRVELDLPPRAGWARVRLSRADHADREVLVASRARLRASARSVRTGPQELLAVDVQAIGASGLATSETTRLPAGLVMVPPHSRRLGALPVPRALRGHTGQHDSRRPGDGGSFRDLHPFGTGDALRRVDWKVTAKRSPELAELWVRRTTALAEAHVVIVVDSRDDVSPDPATWSGSGPARPDEATSLDLARAAAASLTRAYVAAGDRVGVEDLGMLRLPMRPGSGRRHAERVERWLATLRPYGAPRPLVRAPRMPAGALVVLVSTFLDGEPVELAARWSRAGHRVVAVDVLPRLRTAHLSARERLALRLVHVERDDRLAALASAGVELVRWGAGRGEEDLRRAAIRRGRR